MRLFTGLFALCLSASAFAAITPGQEETTLDAIASICGDTWCGGDLLFDFYSFQCDEASSSCVLKLGLTDLVSESDPKAGFTTRKRRYDYSFKDSEVSKTYDFSCRIEGILIYSDLMEGSFLNGELYSTLTDCIHDLEALIGGGKLP